MKGLMLQTMIPLAFSAFSVSFYILLIRMSTCTNWILGRNALIIDSLISIKKGLSRVLKSAGITCLLLLIIILSNSSWRRNAYWSWFFTNDSLYMVRITASLYRLYSTRHESSWIAAKSISCFSQSKQIGITLSTLMRSIKPTISLTSSVCGHKSLSAL